MVPRLTPLLELVEVTKSYREAGAERVVLDNVSVRLMPGEMLCIMGRSGTGKSTLLNIMSGIDLPDVGVVRFAGRDITSASERERTLLRRASIGFVFQFFNLIATLNIEENVRLPLELNGVAASAAHERANALLARLGLGGRGSAFADTLSGGEQQRVAVLRALAHRPMLVLADEPTGNLDVQTGREVLDLLCVLCRENNAGLVMVTHSDEAADRADRVLSIEGGRLASRGDAGSR